jgi:hypothetical protein
VNGIEQIDPIEPLEPKLCPIFFILELWTDPKNENLFVFLRRLLQECPGPKSVVFSLGL